MNSNEYRRLDFSAIQFKNNPTPSEEALRDVEPMNWSQDVMSGKKKIVISKMHEGDDARCAK